MGGNSSKKNNVAVKNSLANVENEKLQEMFSSLKDKRISNLTILWDGQMDKHLKQLVLQYVTVPSDHTLVDEERFKKLFVNLIRGSVFEQSDILIDLLTNCQPTETINCKAIEKYVESLITSYLSHHKNTGWESSSKSAIQLLTSSLCSGLSGQVSHDNVTLWLSNSPKITALQASVFGHLYAIKTSKQRLLPQCEPYKKTHSILSICRVMFINASLPAALRDEWRLLFSSRKHGESFSKLLGYIQKQGPTVLVLKDKGGAVFGGFAPHAWALGPSFVGDETSFLFRLKPSMEVFNSTRFNDHYQYLNTQQQTMPNGLGMGGQFGYWGLWLDAEFGRGQSSETCTTYRDCKMLATSKEFVLDHLEVWAVGPAQVDEETQTTRSVLDSNSEAKAMLEMAGKKSYSDGLREPENLDY